MAVSMALAGAATAMAKSPERLSRSDAATIMSLVAGEQEALGAAEIALAPGFDPMQTVVEMRETAGAILVTRLTPQVPPGAPPHGGRVVVLLAGERRLIRLGTVFNEEDLAGNDVLVEVLDGDGRLAVRLVGASGESDASDLPADVSAPGPLVTAVAASPPRPRRRLGGKALTSTDLIDRAEAAQEIGHETAVIYRVYAIFGDARLPAAYRGSDAAVFESLYLKKVAAEWDTYSPATQAALQPFLVPPAYSGSWANPAPTGVTRLDTGPCSSPHPLWQFADGPGGKVRVWYWVPSDLFGARAIALANEADTVIWPKITDFMGAHAPLSDALSLCSGGDGRLDIYLTDIRISVTAPTGFWGKSTTCSNTAAYINLNRTRPVETLAHEIFHAFQYSFPLSGGGCGTEYDWWAEGSAQWIVDKVYPPSKWEQWVAADLMDKPERSFDIPDNPHIYSTYLLPYYVYRKTGSATFVKEAWEACGGMDAVHAVDATIAGGWERIWPELALHNWNTYPVDDYKRKWDGLPHAPKDASRPTSVNLGGAPDKEYTIPFDLPKVSTKYLHYRFDDPSVRSVRFWNGATFDLQKSAGTLFASPVWDPKPATAAAKEGIRVQALVKIEGKEWQAPADWTDHPAFTFCRDVADERIEELVLIISNSQFLDAGKRAKPSGEFPRLVVSNVGCYKWTGTATAVTTGEGSVQTVVASPLTWERVQEAPTSPSATVQYRATGVVAAAYANALGCSGAGVFDITAGTRQMWTVNYTPVETSAKRTYHLAGISADTFAVTCPPDVAGPGASIVGFWLFSPAVPPFRQVSADGTAIKSTFTSGLTVYTWDLHSEAQP